MTVEGDYMCGVAYFVPLAFKLALTLKKTMLNDN